MKILHCADIHLDSAMTANLDKDKARERRNELLASFKDMVGYAVKECIGVIIIAGDLFDTRNISVGAKKEVYNIIINNPGITFYYLQGNHDNGSFVSYLDEIPANLRMFGKEWTSYNAGIINNGGITKDIVITGVELDSDNAGKIYGSLSLNAGNYNIVVLHGQEASHISKNNAQIISLKDLRNRGIDYLALGHVHEYFFLQMEQNMYQNCQRFHQYQALQNHALQPHQSPFPQGIPDNNTLLWHPACHLNIHVRIQVQDNQFHGFLNP
jgi:DNA repair protein SbcD/Mre11